MYNSNDSHQIDSTLVPDDNRPCLIESSQPTKSLATRTFGGFRKDRIIQAFGPATAPLTRQSEVCSPATESLQTTGVPTMAREMEMVLATKLDLITATYREVSPTETTEIIPSIMARQLIEVRHEWICSQCGCEFYNPGCVLTGLTLNEIIHHVKMMREQAFANHVCSHPSEK